jgi:hypothetical protein
MILRRDPQVSRHKTIKTARTIASVPLYVT